MRGEDPADWAAVFGEQIASEHGFVALPVDALAIAASAKILVEPKPADAAGVSGMLVRLGEEFAISYATHIVSVGFQRFSIAHELGHYFLPGHVDAIFRDGDVHRSRAGYQSSDKYEREADHFASGLLMPRRLFAAAMANGATGLEAVDRLATACQTSLTAAAIQFAKCAKEPVAIVVSSGKRIDYCFMSKPLQEFDGLDWVRKRDLVPSGAPTCRFNTSVSKVQRGERIEGAGSDLQDWFGGERSIEISEDVIGLGGYGKTLTILYDIELPDLEDESGEQELVDSWSPKFRK
jgi:hypothetical protein